jgi:sterol desaturase/sphingolipid hydroxylase (fatty acid hydroxylase superfamily)
MEEKYVAFAIPFFLVAIGIELLVARAQGDVRYRFQDSINSLSCGVGQQVLEPFLRALGLAGYLFLYSRARLLTVPTSSVWGWVALLFGVDFAYYVFHRASHRINFLWASHVVHHQSEEYNLSTALRQSWIEILFQPAFYLPLAILGFHPGAYIAMSTLNTLYQFWIHTRTVNRLGALEWFMNTPSHHRVHHGINPKYIDKNYAGVFIVWDRLLGTFQEEEDEPVYGTVKPLASWNPLWANVTYWVEMAQMARATSRLADRLKVWFMPPEWRPLDLSNGVGYVTIPEASRETQKKYEQRVPLGLSAYVAVSFAAVAAITGAFLWFADEAPFALLAAACALILATMIVWGGLFEGKRWAVPMEAARICATALFALWFARESPRFVAVAILVIAVSLVMAAWVLRYRRPQELPAVAIRA